MKLTSIAKGLLVAGALTLATNAMADGGPRRGSIKDAPVGPAPFSWTGFYVGAHAGYGWSSTDYQLIENATTFPFRGDGAIAGGYLGYNQQFGNIVAGIEGEGSWSRINRKGVTCTIVQTATCGHEVGAIGSIRGRLGLAIANGVLVYASGGWAWADFEATRVFQPGGTPFTAGANSSRDGWTVGAGVEVALTRNWIGRLQFDHYDFGTTTHAVPALSNVSTSRVNLDVNTVRAGLSYKF